jgi:predicted nicotinamide N-methyase
VDYFLTFLLVMSSREEEEVESNLVARYETEDFAYYPSNHVPLHVSVKSATSTVGSNLTGENRDRTGIMIWPATHLLCQWLSERPLCKEAAVLELGCGCGLVGVTAKIASPDLLWVSTDMDDKALELARQNHELNDIATDAAWVLNLKWGDEERIKSVKDELEKDRKSRHFEAIVAADIVYPSTVNQVLQLLFDTVDNLLSLDGTFYLAFCTRDGYRTPQRFIEAASEAGFRISALNYLLDDEVKSKLPPLLDARIFVLRRDEAAKSENELLGELNCLVFPGLFAAVQRAAEESSDEEWEPPAFVEGDDEEEFQKQLLERNE